MAKANDPVYEYMLYILCKEYSIVLLYLIN